MVPGELNLRGMEKGAASMTIPSNDDLVRKAQSVLRPRQIGEFTFATVGAALLTDKGNVYLGVCMDVACGIGFCAEHSAIAAMITAGEHRIEKIVAVWRDGSILPPCGRCREFIHQIDEANWDTQVIVAKDKTVTLRELLPYSS